MQFYLQDVCTENVVLCPFVQKAKNSRNLPEDIFCIISNLFHLDVGYELKKKYVKFILS